MPDEEPLSDYPIFRTWEEFRSINTDFMGMDIGHADLDEFFLASVSASADAILEHEHRTRIRSIVFATRRRCDRLLTQLQSGGVPTDIKDAVIEKNIRNTSDRFSYLVNGSRPKLGQLSNAEKDANTQEKKIHGFSGHSLVGMLFNHENPLEKCQTLIHWADALGIPLQRSRTRAEKVLEACFPFADAVAYEEAGKDYGQGPETEKVCQSIARHALLMIMTSTMPEPSNPTHMLHDVIRERVRESLASFERKEKAAKRKRYKKNKEKRNRRDD